MTVSNASKAAKTVADPNASYETMELPWKRARALCSGESFVKAYDGAIDRVNYRNLLIPFSPSMTMEQYNFYKAEAELPGITGEFAKMLLGGLLRKEPSVTLPDKYAEEGLEWITERFGQDDASITAFLDSAVWEEIQTSRAWIYVDYPYVDNADSLTPDEKTVLKPYPILWKAEEVINWRVGSNRAGKTVLKSVITRGFEEAYKEDNEFHPSFVDTVNVYDLDEQGYFRIRKYQEQAETTSVLVVDGQRQKDMSHKAFVEVDSNENIMVANKRLDFIPAWPLNGQIETQMPMLSAIIDKEVSLYNKMSRRNHLLYGASTYTPVITSDMSDEKFEEIVASGLGTWLHLRQGDGATVLETPTAALADMDRAIAATIEEMAKLGIRMLSPEAAQSGVALELRNAAQTARLGSLANKISRTMEQVITFMINWRYGDTISDTDVLFKLSEDFNPVPLGADWLRLATEWYQQGLLPRSVWIQLLKYNDMVPPEYNDEDAIKEIADGMETVMGTDKFASDIQAQNDVAVQQETAKLVDKVSKK